MTVVHHILVGLGDIKSVSFQCDNCAGRITMRPEDIKEIPYTCPNGHHWQLGESERINAAPVNYMFAGLNKLRLLTSQKSVGFQILLELDAPGTT